MPLRWEILHPERLVHIVAEGPVTLKEMEEHFDTLVAAEALPYAKLFDATNAEPLYSDDDVMPMGARLSAYTANFKSGPLAVIGLTNDVRSTFKRFVNISPSKRPAKIFKTETEARAWLAEQPEPSTQSSCLPARSAGRCRRLTPTEGSKATGILSRDAASTLTHDLSLAV
jgi:hypothetical protein